MQVNNTASLKLITASPARLSEVQANEHGVYWIEQRPMEKGRSVLMHWSDQGPARCLTPPGVSVGNRVNEYGGGSYCLLGDKLYYSDIIQSLWKPFENPVKARLADPTFAQDHFVFVRETPESQSLVEGNLQGEITRTLHDQHDFYAAPRIDPETGRLAFLAWNRPSMPWDHTELYLIENSETSVSLKSFKSQPTWQAGQLYLLSDHTGFGQLYHYQNGDLIPVCKNWPSKADAAPPLWNLAMQTFLPLGKDRFAIIYSREGWYQLGLIEQGILRELDLPFCAYGDQLALWKDQLAFNASSPTEGFAIRLLDLKTLQYRTISEQGPAILPLEEISLPEPLTYPTSDGAVAHAFFYRPKQPNPPLILMSHGGPTYYTHAGFSNKIQFWIQNGFAVLDVNYRGSTGYGRKYWEALKHCWGDADAKDCIAGAEYVLKQGWVNPDQLFIRGSSAGGFLSLCAMASSKLFKAGAIYYGVSDLNSFIIQTHRFESGYNDWLVGKNIKSPVDQLDKFDRPLIFFHGLKDTVVPVSHSEVLYEALKKKGVVTALHTYPEEGHSFKAVETIVDSMTKEIEFFRRFL